MPSRCGPAPPPGCRWFGTERRLVGAASPPTGPRRRSPRQVPLARRLHHAARRNHRGRPAEGSPGERSGPGPAEEIRMRSITTSLTTLLGKTGLLEGDLDYHLLRASMVIIFLFFGYQKWWD